MADNVTGRFTVNQGALGAAARPILTERARRITRRIATQARSDVPVRTGNLGRSITEDPLKFVGPFRVETGVTANAPYAAAVHEGSRPHVIRARNAQFLHFQVGGRDIFTREVHHPGVRARPFLRNAADRVVAEETN